MASYFYWLGGSSNDNYRSDWSEWNPLLWKLASEPNYDTNIDLYYPYSEIPHRGEYPLVKIPVSLNDLIEHVDYWGEGRVESSEGISGFPKSYNVNHQYRLVTTGPDRDKKIPNRIPVLNYDECDTSLYIKDNSVLIVTIAEARINSSCINDIARIINTDNGMVVAYGVCFSSAKIKELADVLKTKGLLPLEKYSLPSELEGLTSYKSHVCYAVRPPHKYTEELTETEIAAIKINLFYHVIYGRHDEALSACRQIGKDVSEVVMKLIKGYPSKVMLFAYKMWHFGAQTIVRDCFPNPYLHILHRDEVAIVNKQYEEMALTIDLNNDRAVWGDGHNSPRYLNSTMSWRFLPVCNKKDEISFNIIHVHHNLFLRMIEEKVKGDAYCWGSQIKEEDSDNDEYKFLLEPWVDKTGNVVFTITNVKYKQRLKLEQETATSGHRRLWGHGRLLEMNDRIKWSIEPIYNTSSTPNLE